MDITNKTLFYVYNIKNNCCFLTFLPDTAKNRKGIKKEPLNSGSNTSFYQKEIRIYTVYPSHYDERYKSYNST